jgi:hypothetical protein
MNALGGCPPGARKGTPRPGPASTNEEGEYLVLARGATQTKTIESAHEFRSHPFASPKDLLSDGRSAGDEPDRSRCYSFVERFPWRLRCAKSRVPVLQGAGKLPVLRSRGCRGARNVGSLRRRGRGNFRSYNRSGGMSHPPLPARVNRAGPLSQSARTQAYGLSPERRLRRRARSVGDRGFRSFGHPLNGCRPFSCCERPKSPTTA